LWCWFSPVMTDWACGAERSAEQAVTLWTRSFGRKPVTPDLARQEGRDVSGRDRQCANASTSATMPEYLEITTVAPPRGFGFLLAREIGYLFPADAPAIRTRTFSVDCHSGIFPRMAQDAAEEAVRPWTALGATAASPVMVPVLAECTPRRCETEALPRESTSRPR